MNKKIIEMPKMKKLQTFDERISSKIKYGDASGAQFFANIESGPLYALWYEKYSFFKNLFPNYGEVDK